MFLARSTDRGLKCTFSNLLEMLRKARVMSHSESFPKIDIVDKRLSKYTY